ncbi:hypothetical protein K491DRAFT_206609 [Lophiostoma macrostomum CBS 122681]|uniref:Uncharacterized protein n=1 Tax=Lophiostoma macrostomum CBS 122681 TaxID=1314788 RepID=A0A6A6TH47_9PLEO|nr:hypothetical protein K491DRAFT_206609 [Lophiostoma macrostomum CBS 122681]
MPLTTILLRTRSVVSTFLAASRTLFRPKDAQICFRAAVSRFQDAGLPQTVTCKTKHWHVIHPLQWDVVTEFSNLVLHKPIKWIQESQDRFVGTSQQVEDFKAARAETAEIAKRSWPSAA